MAHRIDVATMFRPLAEIEREAAQAAARVAILAALRYTNGLRCDAADLLKVPIRTLTRRISELGLADEIGREAVRLGWPPATARATKTRLAAKNRVA